MVASGGVICLNFNLVAIEHVGSWERAARSVLQSGTTGSPVTAKSLATFG